MESAQSLVASLVAPHLSGKPEPAHFVTMLYGVLCPDEPHLEHLRIAKDLELLKTATLVVDDFLDRSERRNGVPTIYAAEGAEVAVLTGEILASTAMIDLIETLRRLPQVFDRFVAVELVIQTYRTVCEGQLEDKKLEACELDNPEITEEKYLSVIEKTTATFIQMPVLLGAIVSGMPDNKMQTIAEYGRTLGLAYQIRDDVLDLIADSESTGKNSGTDIRLKKKRLPVIHCIRSGNPKAASLLTAAFREPAPLPDELVRAVVGATLEAGSVQYCVDLVNRLCEEAVSHLHAVDSAESRRQLADIAGMLTTLGGINEDAARSLSLK